jgi:uncharacterized protein YyaL (SSP411 family)
MSEDGLFYSASDADSEGHEGTYFVYGHAEVADALEAAGFGPEETREILQALHITPEGNFEGKNIVRLEEAQQRPEWFGQVREVLRALREKREYPFIDRKVQTSWSAMAVRGLLELGKTEVRYTGYAIASLEALLAFLMPDGTLYHTALIHGTPKIEAFLEDYAWLGTALVKAYETTLEEKYLLLARKLADTALERFHDSGRWYFSRGEFTTDADPTDSSYPGSIGVMTDLLLSLGILVEGRYRDLAFRTLEYHSAKLAKTPVHFPYLFNQAVRYLYEDRLVKAEVVTLREAAGQLDAIPYPYLRRRASTEAEGFMLCGTQSCFAQTGDPRILEKLLQNSIASI